MVHGVQIGPKLFTEHNDIVLTFLSGMTIATVLMLPVGLFLGRFIYSAVTKMPKSYLVPMVALMLVIGSFAIQNNYHDIVIMLVLGIVAWVISRFGFPAPPIVLGLLLGPIAEQGFAQALMIGRAKDAVLAIFFARPISVALIGCILAAIILPPLLRRSSLNRLRMKENVST